MGVSGGYKGWYILGDGTCLGMGRYGFIKDIIIYVFEVVFVNLFPMPQSKIIMIIRINNIITQRKH